MFSRFSTALGFALALAEHWWQGLQLLGIPVDRVSGLGSAAAI